MRLRLPSWTLVSTMLILSLAVTGQARADVIERVVAVVNSDAIWLSELRRRASPFIESAMQGTTSKEEQKSRISLLYSKLVNALIDEQLISQAARKMHVTVTSLEVDQAIDNVRRQNNLTRDQFFDAVRDQGFTEKQYRADVRKQLLRLKVMNQRVRARVTITDEQIREAYNARVRGARRKQRFRAAHIFLQLPEQASAVEVAETLKKASVLRSGLSATNFDAKMQEHGGTDLGWLDQGDLPEALEVALLGLEPGQISGAVRGPSGVHVFLLRERQAGSLALPSFEDSQEGLRRELTERGMMRQEEIFLGGLRRKAVIDVRTD